MTRYEKVHAAAVQHEVIRDDGGVTNDMLYWMRHGDTAPWIRKQFLQNLHGVTLYPDGKSLLVLYLFERSKWKWLGV